MQNIIHQMERFAAERNIPIIVPQTRKFLTELCAKHKPTTILEVGTAIGFSASVMLSACDAKIVCCEASAPNIAWAKANFKMLGLTDRVNILSGDCLDTLPTLMGQQFDLIFLDGPKGKYPEILELLLPLLAPSGILVADNVLFRGMVQGGAAIPYPRFVPTVQALRNFLEQLRTNPKLETEVKDIGDGLAIARWR